MGDFALSAGIFSDGKIPIDVEDLSKYYEIAQMKQQKPMQELSRYKAG
jgi:hypothetical protein